MIPSPTTKKTTQPSRGELIKKWQSWRNATFESEEEIQMGVALNQASNRSVVTAIVEASRVKRVLAKEMDRCNTEYRAFNPKLALEKHTAAVEENAKNALNTHLMSKVSSSSTNHQTDQQTSSSKKKKEKNATLPLALLYDVVIPPPAEGEEHDFTGRTFACLADLPLYTKVLIFQFLPIYPPKLLDDLAWLKRAVAVNDGAALRGADVTQVLKELETIKHALRETHVKQFGVYAVYYHCLVNTSRTTAPKHINHVNDEHYVLVPDRLATGDDSTMIADGNGKGLPRKIPTESAAALTLTAGAVAGVRGLLRTHLYFRDVSDQELPDLYPEHTPQADSAYYGGEETAEQYTDDDLLFKDQQNREAKRKADVKLKRRAYLASQATGNSGEFAGAGGGDASSYLPPFRHTQQQAIHEDLKWCFTEIQHLSDRYSLYGHWVTFREQVWKASCFDLRPVLHKALSVWEGTLEVWGRRRTDVLGKAAQQEWETLNRRLPAVYYLGDPVRTNEDIKNIFREVGGLKFPDSSAHSHDEHCAIATDLEALLRERDLRTTKERALNQIYVFDKIVERSDRDDNNNGEGEDSNPLKGIEEHRRSTTLQQIDLNTSANTTTTTVHNTSINNKSSTCEDDTASAPVVSTNENDEIDAFAVETSNQGHLTTASTYAAMIADLGDDLGNMDRYGLAGIVSGSAIRAAKELSRTYPAPNVGGTGISSKYARSLTLSQCATLGLLDVPWVRGYSWEVRTHGADEESETSPQHGAAVNLTVSPSTTQVGNSTSIFSVKEFQQQQEQKAAQDAAVLVAPNAIDHHHEVDPDAPVTPRTALRMLRGDNWMADALAEVKHTTRGSAHRLLDGHHKDGTPKLRVMEADELNVSGATNAASTREEDSSDRPLDWSERKLRPDGWIDASTIVPLSPPPKTSKREEDVGLQLHMPPRDEEHEKAIFHRQQADKDKHEQEALEEAAAAQKAVDDEKRAAWLVAAEGMSQRIWRPSLRFRPRQDHQFGGCEMCCQTPVHFVGLARSNSGASQHIVVCRKCYDECYSVILKEEFTNTNTTSPSMYGLSPQVLPLIDSMLMSGSDDGKGGANYTTMTASNSDCASPMPSALQQALPPLMRKKSADKTRSRSASTTGAPFMKSKMVYQAIATARAIEAYVESANEPEADRPSLNHIDLTLTPNARRVANSLYKWFTISDLVQK